MPIPERPQIDEAEPGLALCPTRRAFRWVAAEAMKARMRWTLCLAALLWTGCDDEDVGRCCTLIGEIGRDDPTPTANFSAEGSPINDIAIDPAFDCASLTCVVFQPSMEAGADNRAYCTAPCALDEDCPVGFACRDVLQSAPGPDAPIQPGDRFCVQDDPGEACFD